MAIFNSYVKLPECIPSGYFISLSKMVHLWMIYDDLPILETVMLHSYVK